MNFGALISKHRAAIMGIAAIWIVFFHAHWENGIAIWRAIINRCGNMGVDIFVFLAGFGCVYSLKKNDNFYRFYMRRAERILPSYYVALTIMMVTLIIAGSFSRQWFLANYIPLGVWAGVGTAYWYIPATLGYYVMVPLFFYGISKARFPRIMMIIGLLFTTLLIPSFANIEPLAMFRIPALVMGVALGVFMQMHQSKKDQILDFALFAAVCLFGLMTKEMPALKGYFEKALGGSAAYRMRKDIVTPFLVILMAYGCEFLSRTPLRGIVSLLGKAGKYSLEIYLSHIIVRGFAIHLVHLGGLGQLIAMLVCSYPLAVAISWMGNKLLAFCKKLPIFKTAEN